MTKRTIHRRAVEAAIWGQPMLAFDAMRQAYFRDAKPKYSGSVRSRGIPPRKLKLDGRLTADVVDADGVAELERLVAEIPRSHTLTTHCRPNRM